VQGGVEASGNLSLHSLEPELDSLEPHSRLQGDAVRRLVDFGVDVNLTLLLFRQNWVLLKRNPPGGCFTTARGLRGGRLLKPSLSRKPASLY
jgi:hypothetical protein